MAGMVSLHLLPMTYSQLIDAGTTEFDRMPYQAVGGGVRVFEHGARWMRRRMNSLDNRTEKELDHTTQYTVYGVLKYSCCIIAAIVAGMEFYHLHFLLTPLAIVIFYCVEVHFLFLFPLILDGARRPLLASIRLTYRIGYFRALVMVMRLGGFMVAGLFNLKNPTRNWHIGCLAVIIWYQHEGRNRIYFPF